MKIEIMKKTETRNEAQVSRGFEDYWKQINATGSHPDYDYGWIQGFLNNEARIEVIKNEHKKE